MSTKQRFFTIITTLFIAGLAVTGVAAQEASPVVTSIPLPSSSPSQSQAAELRRLKTQYRGELEEYRRVINQYTITKNQYQQLKTLTALEDAVRSTQSAMEVRARVLRTYLQILKITLLEQTGVDIEQKQAALEHLNSVITKLEAHQQQLTTELDKVAVGKVTTEFVLLGEEIKEASYRIQTLIAIGEIQSVFDKSLNLTEEMKTNLATQGGAIQQGKRQRAFEETDRELVEAREQLQLIRQEVDENRGSGYESTHRNLLKDLEETHGQLTQVLSFLKELVKL